MVQDYYCHWCGKEFPSILSLTADKCSKSPLKSGKHTLPLGLMWENETQNSRRWPDFLRTREILYKAYLLGIINWTVYNEGLEKVTRVQNGSWMFETTYDGHNVEDLL